MPMSERMHKEKAIRKELNELKAENAKLRDFVEWIVDMRVGEVEPGKRLARGLLAELST
jgi:hypothetical protein